MLTKPPHGSPCNNCGQCCADQRCPLAQIVFGPGGSCPALEMRLPSFGPSFGCGLVDHPERYAPGIVAASGKDTASRAAAYLIGAGRGCDALLRGERPDHAWRARAMQAAADDQEASKRAAMVWMLHQRGA